MLSLPEQSESPVNVNVEAPNNAYSILLIESDRMVSALLKSSLERVGYTVNQVFCGESAHNAVMNFKPEIIILDISLPGVDGFSLCQTIREAFKGPLLIVTSRNSESDQITALGLGADDYLIKPVSINILKARIEALTRRVSQLTEEQSPEKIEVGDIALFPQSQQCKVKGQSIRLSGFEFQLLLLLLSNEGKVLTRDQIYNLLLGREYNGLERTIDVRISTLRDKLAKKGMKKTKIETVWGKGYILNGSAT
ncbi:response regulator transcription factor [Thalassotalea sp. PLHSN55]|uniref:response regulator transcription factor n=1 Tax=Thalassotalea sp. PLHSN55 TaxID=3435888 RepID=UPI003F827ECE